MQRPTPGLISLALLGLALLITTHSAAAQLRIEARDHQGNPTFFTGDFEGLAKSGDLEGATLGFLERFAETHLGADGEESFEVERVRRDELGQVLVRCRQTLRGLPVVGAEMVVHLDAESRRVIAVNGRFAKDEGQTPEPLVSAEEALAGALADAGILQPELLEEPRLTFVLDADSESARLAWSALVRYEGEPGLAEDLIFADAQTGGFITRHPQIFHVLDRRVYDGNNGSALPGTLVISEGGSSTDPVAQTTYTWLGVVTAYYYLVFGRDSYDDAGGQELATVHHRSNYNNAFWTGNGNQLVFGDGDGSTFSPLGDALDVVGHEFTHGVTRAESNLVYARESGALNESLSDVFGALIDAHWQGVNANTWKIGEAVYTPGTSGDALRYMNDPTDDGYSRDYYPDRLYPGSCTPSDANDKCGVHGNSGIGNLAFFLLSQGGRHPRNRSILTVAGIGIFKAGQIFYRASLALTSSSGYEDMRAASVQAATDLYGASSLEARMANRAWCTVGVGGGACPYELSGSGTTFAGMRMAFLSWKMGGGSSTDVYKNGVKVATTANDGSFTHMFSYLGTPPTANYWVCPAGTSSYDGNTCSNVITVSFGLAF